MATTATPTPLNERIHALLVGLLVSLRDTGSDDEVRACTLDALSELCTLLDGDSSRDATTLCQIESLVEALMADHALRAELAMRHDGVVGVRSGIAHLDETLNGFEAGKLYLLAAMPGAGKTTLALQWADTVAQAGYPALYICLENDAIDLARKTTCRLAGLSYTAALKGKIDPMTWAAAQRLDTLRGRLYISTPRAAMPDIAGLVADVSERAGQPPALVVLDYLQAFAKRAVLQAERADVRERIDRLTPALRTPGERFGCAVLAISSQNRAGYAGGGMASLKESGDLEYGADVTMILSRVTDGSGVQGMALRASLTGLTPLQLTVDKNCQGLTGRPIMLSLHGDRCTVGEVQP